jgi:two-component system cell cycle sensor histidine kinase/response regulator CckA
MLQRLIGEDVVLTTALCPTLAATKADPGQLEQVLMNLSVNARDAMPQGGRLTIETRNVTLDEAYAATHPDVRPGNYVMLAVCDTGTGIVPQTKARIFEPFFTTKGPGKGTGLGLAVVHGIVKQTGGHVEVYSEVGKGTTFKIYLPVIEEQLPAGTSVHALGLMPRGTETVLLVEDEDALRALARHVLESCGYTVLEAADGREALRVAEGHLGPIDLLVSDVVMPHLGGRQLAERLAVMKSGMKVMFLSGYTDDAVVRHGVLEAEFAFLQKPFTPPALAQKVREALDKAMMLR